jgi:poly(3-hydroxybutyrate) depolymerase
MNGSLVLRCSALLLLAACASGGTGTGPGSVVDVDAAAPPSTPDAPAAAAPTRDGPAAPAPADAPAVSGATDAGGANPPARDAAIAADAAGAPALADAAAPGEGKPAPVGSAGCAMAGGLPEGPATIDVAGASRSYILRLPAGYSNARPWPLVLALHPNGGAGIGFWDGEGDRPLRRLLRDKAILVLPLARGTSGNWDWRGDLPADLAYFEALIARLEGKLCVDQKRIFSMGFSGGGSFSGVLGCRRTDIRAIAAGSGVSYFDAKDCVGTPAAWFTVGEEELIASRVAFRDYFRTRNGCQATTSPTTPAAGCVAYACPPGAPVVFCPHPGGHLWPAFGTEAAVTFFSQF